MLTPAEAREELVEGAICPTCGQSYHARNRVKPIGAIRDKLLHGIPPLTDEECLFLFRVATGETIVRRKRCAECGGSGKHKVVMWCDLPKWIDCPTCKGEGYVE